MKTAAEARTHYRREHCLYPCTCTGVRVSVNQSIIQIMFAFCSLERTYVCRHIYVHICVCLLLHSYYTELEEYNFVCNVPKCETLVGLRKE